MKSTRLALWGILSALILSLGFQLHAERGVASFYHDRFHGRRMANGQLYHRDSMTCAHRRYPLGTWLRVVNPKNGHYVVVQVTDRGPYSHNFTIDLSRAAARQLEIITQGHAMVEITKVGSREGGIIPFRLEDEEPEDIVDIELDFVPASEYPYPEWWPDSIE